MEDMEYIKIPLHGKHGEGKFALVDGDYDGEYFSLYKWYVLKTGYVARKHPWETGSSKNNSYIYLHQEVSRTPRGMVTDHIDRNKLNNRSCNLRWATYSENATNRPQAKSGTRVGKYRGVSRARYVRSDGNRQWFVLVSKKYIGGFNSETEAAIAYDKAVVAKWGKDAITNFPISNYL